MLHCSKQLVSIAIVALLLSTVHGKMLYENGNWDSTWWYPKQAAAPVPGTQVMLPDSSPRVPHLIFVPAGSPPCSRSGAMYSAWWWWAATAAATAAECKR